MRTWAMTAVCLLGAGPAHAAVVTLEEGCIVRIDGLSGVEESSAPRRLTILDKSGSPLAEAELRSFQGEQALAEIMDGRIHCGSLAGLEVRDSERAASPTAWQHQWSIRPSVFLSRLHAQDLAFDPSTEIPALTFGGARLTAEARMSRTDASGFGFHGVVLSVFAAGRLRPTEAHGSGDSRYSLSAHQTSSGATLSAIVAPDEGLSAGVAFEGNRLRSDSSRGGGRRTRILRDLESRSLGLQAGFRDTWSDDLSTHGEAAWFPFVAARTPRVGSESLKSENLDFPQLLRWKLGAAWTPRPEVRLSLFVRHDWMTGTLRLGRGRKGLSIHELEGGSEIGFSF